eukprot:RCo000113
MPQQSFSTSDGSCLPKPAQLHSHQQRPLGHTTKKNRHNAAYKRIYAMGLATGRGRGVVSVFFSREPALDRCLRQPQRRAGYIQRLSDSQTYARTPTPNISLPLQNLGVHRKTGVTTPLIPAPKGIADVPEPRELQGKHCVRGPAALEAVQGDGGIQVVDAVGVGLVQDGLGGLELGDALHVVQEVVPLRPHGARDASLVRSEVLAIRGGALCDPLLLVPDVHQDVLVGPDLSRGESVGQHQQVLPGGHKLRGDVGCELCPLWGNRRSTEGEPQPVPVRHGAVEHGGVLHPKVLQQEVPPAALPVPCVHLLLVHHHTAVWADSRLRELFREVIPQGLQPLRGSHGQVGEAVVEVEGPGDVAIRVSRWIANVQHNHVVVRVLQHGVELFRTDKGAAINSVGVLRGDTPGPHKLAPQQARSSAKNGPPHRCEARSKAKRRKAKK